MANPSKAKGTRAESNVVRYLAYHGIDATRKPLAGSADKGDIDILDGLIAMEVKAGRQTDKPSRQKMEEWMRQAQVEAGNAKALAALCVVRYRRSLCDAEVYTWIRGKRTMMYLDEFTEFLLDQFLKEEGREVR